MSPWGINEATVCTITIKLKYHWGYKSHFRLIHYVSVYNLPEAPYANARVRARTSVCLSIVLHPVERLRLHRFSCQNTSPWTLRCCGATFLTCRDETDGTIVSISKLMIMLRSLEGKEQFCDVYFCVCIFEG